MWSLNFDQIWINKWKNEPKTITGKTFYIFYALLSINFVENFISFGIAKSRMYRMCNCVNVCKCVNIAQQTCRCTILGNSHTFT